MIYREEQRDLFSVPTDNILVHCISSDFALGAGIAKTFHQKYDVKEQLEQQYSNYQWSGHGTCLMTNSSLAEDGTGNWLVCNLVTKERYWHKPTYQTLKESLYSMKFQLMEQSLSAPKLAMPLIGCGLDRLEWNRVREMVQEIFRDTDAEILVCLFGKQKEMGKYGQQLSLR